MRAVGKKGGDSQHKEGLQVSDAGEGQTCLCGEEQRHQAAVDNLVEIRNHPCQGVDMQRHLLNASWQISNLKSVRSLSTSTPLLSFMTLPGTLRPSTKMR